PARNGAHEQPAHDLPERREEKRQIVGGVDLGHAIIEGEALIRDFAGKATVARGLVARWVTVRRFAVTSDSSRSASSPARHLEPWRSPPSRRSAADGSRS